MNELTAEKIIEVIRNYEKFHRFLANVIDLNKDKNLKELFTAFEAKKEFTVNAEAANGILSLIDDLSKGDTESYDNMLNCIAEHENKGLSK